MQISIDFFAVLRQRGFIHQGSDEAGLSETLLAGVLCARRVRRARRQSPRLTSASVVGAALAEKTGGKPLVPAWGGTALVGAPGFRDSVRPMPSDPSPRASLQRDQAL
jgi:tyrosyl-tRNA synthetase